MARPLPRPWRVVLASLLFLIPAAQGAGDSKDTWVEVRSPDFTVASNAGEKEARHVARQFEEIRSVYHDGFPKLRLDLGKPIIILAAKNENTMKALLPEYWEQKGRVHPGGLYAAGEEKHYVALQVNAAGENPYHTLYHEYTHAILHVNFPPLPLWLDEGLAELYGNTSIGDKESRVGRPDSSHLQLLQQNKLIPVDVLLQVDHTSPYYNEQNRASVFYAESWALAHYLVMDPDARKQDLLKKFLDAWNKSGNQVEAARQTFGDLKRFGQKIEAYARQDIFYSVRVKSMVQTDEKSYESRALPVSESLAMRGDFHLHRGRMPEAKVLLEEALRQDGNQAAAHEAMGLYYFRQQQMENAAKEFERATELNSKGFLTYYFSAILNLQQARGMPDAWPKAESSLEKAIALNPNFAPAYGSLASLYSIRPEAQEKALTAARRAVQLEPGTMSYAVNLGYVLLNMNRQKEAQALASRISAAAKSPAEVAMAQAFQMSVEGRAGVEVRLHATPGANAESSDSEDRIDTARGDGTGSTRGTVVRGTECGELKLNEASAGSASATGDSAGGASTSLPTRGTGPAARIGSSGTSSGGASSTSTSSTPSEAVTDVRTYEMSGTITALDCSHAPEVTLTIAMGSLAMKLHAVDLTKLAVKGGRIGAQQASARAKTPTAVCTGLKGHSAKMSYRLTPGQSYDGELASVQLY